jgi:hypothetical protein
MDLDLCRYVKAKCIKKRAMILQFPDAPFYHIVSQGIDQHKLIRMHGDPHPVVLNEPSDRSQSVLEMAIPIECADGVRSKGDRIRANPEEHEAVQALYARIRLRQPRLFPTASVSRSSE